MGYAWSVILITFIAGVVGTGIGGLIGALFKKDSSKVVSLLLSFAGGIMLAVVCFDLIQEALHPFGGTDISYKEVLFVVGFTIVGYFIVYGINCIVDLKLKKEVPHTNEETHPSVHDNLDEIIHADHLHYHKQKGNSLFIAGLVMALVIALHNLPEGMVIGASFAKDEKLIIGGAGFLTAVVLGLHNIPEGMAVSVPLIAGGTKRWKAVLYTALSGLPTVLGAVAGFFLGGISDIWLSICLSLASGAMLYVVFGELLPQSVLMWKSKFPTFMLVVGLLLGLILVLL